MGGMNGGRPELKERHETGFPRDPVLVWLASAREF